MKRKDENINDEFFKELSGLKETPQLSEEKKKQLWAKIQDRAEKEKPARNTYWAAYAARAAAIFIVCVSAVYLITKLKFDREIVLTYTQNGESRQTSLDKNKFNSDSLFIEGKINGKINVWFKNVIDLKGKEVDSKLVLSFNEGSVIFQIPEKLKEPEEIEIITRQAVFTITGTEFLLNVSSAETLLVVKEGTLQVSYEGLKKEIGSTMLWHSSSPEKIENSDNLKIEKSFSDFKKKTEINIDPKYFKKETSRWLNKKATVSLKNGNKIYGTVTGESETNITIQSGIGSPITVKLEKIENIIEGLAK